MGASYWSWLDPQMVPLVLSFLEEKVDQTLVKCLFTNIIIPILDKHNSEILCILSKKRLFFVSASGVYVEKVADSTVEGPYMGLLGIGDEILQVNGETVAGLSLDQVTRLMTQESTASLRVMPARRLQR